MSVTTLGKDAMLGRGDALRAEKRRRLHHCSPSPPPKRSDEKLEAAEVAAQLREFLANHNKKAAVDVPAPQSPFVAAPPPEPGRAGRAPDAPELPSPRGLPMVGSPPNPVGPVGLSMQATPHLTVNHVNVGTDTVPAWRPFKKVSYRWSLSQNKWLLVSEEV